MKQLSALLLLVGLFAVIAAMANAAEMKIPAKWKNCAAVNKRCPHGIGRNSTQGSATTRRPASYLTLARQVQAA
jgi:hypothetical protein